MTKLVVLGSGGHAKVVIEILRAMGQFDILGVTSTDLAADSQFFGLPVLGSDEVLSSLRAQGVQYASVAVGGYTDNSLRRNLYEKAKELGFKIVTAIHPTACVSPTAVIGEGSVIFPGAIIHTEAKIGQNCIVATGATIDHETEVKDHALISAGVCVGAQVLIGEEALLAIGSTVISGKKIGRRAVVGSGAVVVDDVNDETRVFGVPAKPKKD